MFPDGCTSSNETKLGPVLSKDMETPPLKNGQILMKDAQCAETKEKSVFQFLRFLFFELLRILFIIFECFRPTKNETENVDSQDAQCSETDF